MCEVSVVKVLLSYFSFADLMLGTYPTLILRSWGPNWCSDLLAICFVFLANRLCLCLLLTPHAFAVACLRLCLWLRVVCLRLQLRLFVCGCVCGCVLCVCGCGCGCLFAVVFVVACCVLRVAVAGCLFAVVFVACVLCVCGYAVWLRVA